MSKPVGLGNKIENMFLPDESATPVTVWSLGWPEPRQVDLPNGKPVTFGRSMSNDVQFADHPTLSRHALTIRAQPSGHTDVLANQAFGGIHVLRNGVPSAKLTRGEQVRLLPEYSYRLQVLAQIELAWVEILARRSRRPYPSLGPMEATPATVGGWRLDQIMNPPPEFEWQAVAALAAVVVMEWSGSGKSPFARLKDYCAAWLDRPFSNGALTNRLDAALAQLQIQAHGDKVPQLGRRVLDIQVLEQSDYLAIQEELRRRRETA